MKVFCGMDIGSAKISQDEMRGIPHHLLNIADVSDSFSAGQYAVEAVSVITDIIKRGRVPLVVGGSGLYFRTLMEGASGAPPSSPASKAMVEEMVQRDGGVWDVR